MPTKNLTLGLALVCASTALAHHREHHVHKASTAVHHSAGGYVIRNGDFDWAIAHKHGISVAKLHRANPSVDWDALQVGTHIRIPGSEGGSAPAHEQPHYARHAPSSHGHPGGPGLYAVREGDNDWILAHKAGITIRELKAMNPGVNWDHIHPGQHVHLPGSSISVVSARRIHTRYAKIVTDAVRIHRAQGLHADVITTVDSGVRAKVLDRDGNWYRLRFPKGTEGWVRADYLASAAEPEHVASRRSRHHRLSSFVARRHRRHHHGNNPGEYIASNEIPDTDLMHKAFSMKGTPYVWGGASRSGTDCSGFVKQVYHSQGINLPRTSREQAHVGEKVTRDHLRAGDILLFHTGRGSRVTHAAIYVGHGKFIHASSSGGKVQVNSLNEPYYDHRLVTARRISKK